VAARSLVASGSAKTTKMIERFLSRVSIAALLTTALLFVAANCISYMRMQSRLQIIYDGYQFQRIYDGYAECGFPFSLYGYGGFAPVSQILWIGLIADYLIAIVASVAVGMMCKDMGMKSREMAKIRYGGFWDRPLEFLVERKGKLFLFYREFDGDFDEYEDAYRVFVLSHAPNEDLSVPVSWQSCTQIATNFIGTVPVADVHFDQTFRKEIEINVLEELLRKNRPDIS
jgi:hypothetical protein